MISRNRVARIQLKRELTQRYKPNTNRDRVSTKDELTKLRNINRDSKNKETVKQVDKKDLFKYDLERGIITVKSHKFAPHVETEPPEPSEPPVDVCAQFDTDFESNCDYISRLYLLGPYTILENYEASTTDTVQPMMVDLHPIIQPEDWETTTSGYMIDFTQSPATTSDMVGSDVYIGTPQNFTLTKDLALSSIELAWDDVQNEDNYVVERSDGNNTNYIVLDTLSQNVTSYTDSNNLVLDTTYYYRVKGISSEFEGSYATNNILYAEGFKAGVPSSLEFNTNSIITQGSPEFSFGTGDFAISLWFYQYSTGSYRTLFEWYRYNDGILVRPNGSTGIQVYINYSESSTIVSVDLASMVNQWHYIMMTRIAGVVHFYIDDQEVHSYANTSNIDIGAGDIGFGVSLHSPGQRFLGRMDRINAWSRGFTLSESIDSMNSQLGGTEPNLIFNYKLNEGTGLVANDSRGVHDGVIENDTWVSG